MKKYTLKLLAAICMLAMVTACAAHKPLGTFSPHDFTPEVLSGKYSKRVESFHVLLDMSDTMNSSFQGTKKACIAKRTVHNMNKTIPEVQLTAGLRIFGHGWKDMLGPETRLVYGMTDYSRKGLGKAVCAQKYAGGNTPLATALTYSAHDMVSARAPIALIIVSDGMETDSDPVASVTYLKGIYGDQICIYTVLIGDDPGGKKTLEAVAKAGGCGFMTTAEELASAEGMADFVKKVFLKGGAPAPVAQPAIEPEPRVIKKIVINDIRFDFDSAEIKPEFFPALDQAGEILQGYPGRNVIIEGHTCSVGPADYNKGLSVRRAKSTKAYLVGKGLDAGRLIVKGRGEDNPVADNTTRNGRMMNRRVEFKVLAD
ncbi:OmpA family protein [Thermodesulfobacteriota bacterium]